MEGRITAYWTPTCGYFDSNLFSPKENNFEKLQWLGGIR